MGSRAKELREKKTEELDVLDRDLSRELAEETIKLRMGTSSRTARLGQIRRDRARIQTIRKEKVSHEKTEA